MITTLEDRINSVKSCGLTLQYINIANLTHEVCLIAVKKNGLAVQYVPPHLLSEDVCIEAVRQNGHALKHIPHAKYTYEVCIEAVHQTGNALQYACAAVSSGKSPLELSPVQLENIYLTAVTQNGHAVRFVTRDTHSAASVTRYSHIFLAAVRQNGYVLSYIPPHLQTEEICLEAVKNYAESIRFAREDLQTEAVGLAAVSQDAFTLRYIKNQTPRVCCEAVLRAEKSYRYILNKKCLYHNRPLPEKTECLISRDIIGYGHEYRMCSLKEDHVISEKSFVELRDMRRSHNASFDVSCEFCKSKIRGEIFVNKIK